MMNSLFLQSDVADPYALYAGMRAAQPVYYDESNRIWAIYTYADCKRVLESGSAHIPEQNLATLPLLGDVASTLVASFARLSNPPHHAVRRQAVMHLLAGMQAVDVGSLLAQLLGQSSEFDWVNAVCKTLPALAVMKAFGFADSDIDKVLPNIERLTKIMLPNKTPAHIDDINAVADDVCAVVDGHVMCALPALPALAGTAESRILHVANLIGLLIQSYDAGRGILSNALLQALRMERRWLDEEWKCVVVETLRFDPPIQNTRRVLNEDLMLGGRLLPKGAAVLLVLASANRDVAVFEHADRFDADRRNNDAHLTFGAGGHACAAHRFATRLATQALAALFRGDRRVALLQEDIRYEAMVNARLPTRILLRYSS